jgi:MoaA/NifB/PqqE/SkfB family radical SAM enzyme
VYKLRNSKATSLNKNELIKYSLSKFANSYLDGLAHFLNLPLSKPTNISVGITLKCNLKCTHCDIWKLKPKDELDKNQWMKFIKSLHEWLGTYQISFAGGEPLIYSDIFEIIEYASSLGVITSLVTSGSLLDKNRLTKLLESKIDTVNISLDSINPDLHDKIRGVKGVHGKVIKAIDQFIDAGKSKKLILAAVIMGSNIDEIIPLTNFSKEKGLFGISFQVLTDNFGRTYKHNWFKDSDNFTIDYQKLEKVVDNLLELKKNGYPILNASRQLGYIKQYFKDPTLPFPISCKVGFNNLRIGPTGEVQFCNLSKSFGNILDQKPQDLWYSKLAKNRRRELRHCQMSCSIQNCYFKKTVQENFTAFKRKWNEFLDK